MGVLVFECFVRSVEIDDDVCFKICPIHETLAAYVLTKYLVCSWVYQIHSNVIFIWIEIDDLNVCLWSFEKYS